MIYYPLINEFLLNELMFLNELLLTFPALVLPELQL